MLSDKYSIPTSYGTHEVYLGNNETITYPNIMRTQALIIIIDVHYWLMNHVKSFSQLLTNAFIQVNRYMQHQLQIGRAHV